MKFPTAIMFAFSAILGCNAENLLFNSSFELGDKGYSGIRKCKAGNGYDIKYSGEPLAVDETTAVQGRNSIRLDNPNADMLRFSTHEFQVVPGKTYTLSFWVKGDKEDTPFNVMFASRGWSWWGNGKNVFISSAGKEWKRVSFTFTTPKENIKTDGNLGYYGVIDHYFVAIDLGRSFKDFKSIFAPAKDLFSTAGTLWLDGMQVEEGGLSAYAPAAPVEAAVYAKENIIVAPDVIKGELKAISYQERKNAFEIGVSLYDRHYAKTIENLNFKFNLKPGETASKDFEFKTDKLGGFEIRSSLATPLNCYQSMAVLAKVATAVKGGEGSFTLGTTGSVDGIHAYPGVPEISAYYPDLRGSPAEWARTFQIMKSPIWRAHDASFLVWSQIEPEKDKFNWEKADRCVEAAERAGIKLLPDLLEKFDKKNTPEWARLRDRFNPEGTEFPELKLSSGSTPKTNLPQLEDWAGYVRSVAEHYKGRIYAYEICNEPYFGFIPKHYVEYQKVAYEEIKKADPNAIVVGVCATEDRQAKCVGFLRQCLQLGAAKYCDVISFHPYGGNQDDAKVSAMELIKDMRTAIKEESGHDKPLWMEECYYLRNNWGAHMKELWQVYEFDDSAIARRCIIDLGEGCVASTPTDINSLFKNEIQPWSDKFTWERSTRCLPSDKLSVFVATNNFLNGAEPVKRVMLPGLMCYIFKNHDKIFSAIWSLKNGGIANITAPEGCKLEVYDVMGNKLEESLSKVNLELDRNPRYIEWNFGGGLFGLGKGAPSQGQLDLTEKALMNAGVLTVSDAVLCKKNGKWLLAASLTNSGASAISSSELQINSPAFAAAPVKLSFKELGSGQTETLETPVELRDEGKPAPVSFPLSSKGTSLEFKTDLRPIEALDVYSGIMTDFIPIKKAVDGKADSGKDMSASFQVGYEEGSLLLSVKVKDDVAGKNWDNEPYRSDCIELFIDALPWDASGKHFYQVFILPRKVEGERVSVAGGKKLNVKETTKILSDGYEVEIKVDLSPKVIGGRPWLKDAPIRFDIAIDDSDADKRKSQTVWTGSAGNYSDRTGLGILQFKRTAQVRVDVVTKDNRRPRTGINASVGPEWRTLSFTFTPNESGVMRLQLLSGWSPDKKDRYWVYYRNLKAEGALLENGDFSKLDNAGNPVGWRLENGSSLIKGEQFNYVKCAHDHSCLGGNLRVEAGKPVTVSYEARASEPIEPVESEK